MRTVGVEEELLLVDPKSGGPRSVATRILKQAGVLAASPRPERRLGSLEHEYQQQMLETNSAPHADLTELADDIRHCRNQAITAARGAGVRVVASGSSPVLIALSANSPFWQGIDSRYASFRSQVMLRWPTAGAADVFGSAANYHATVEAMLRSSVMLDKGMVYYDARLSHHVPTVEIRVADVCPDAADAVLLAALVRGLVDTAATAWRAGEAPAPVPSSMLRLGTWQAGRYGVGGDLLDPLTLSPRAAAEVVTDLVEHVRPALAASGDEALVEFQVGEVLRRGNGADRQRTVFARTGQLADVVADLARVTSGQDTL